MTEQVIRTATEAIDSAIENTTSNTLNAVFSIIESYKALILKPEVTDAYDAGKRDAIQELTTHLRRFEAGITKKEVGE
jgi:hypothetical protein